MVADLSLLAVFLTGLLGGVHCAGMCGGIVGALGMLQQTRSGRRVIPLALEMSTSGAGGQGSAVMVPEVARRPSPLLTVTAWNLGRMLTYTGLGAVAGGIGSVAWLMQSLLPVQQMAFLISSLLVLLMGLYVMGLRGIGTVVESLGARLWRHVQPLASARLRSQGLCNAVLTGGLWGLVPCGMVYAVLSAALVSGSWQNGAMLMLAFALGTLPNLMVLGLAGQWLAGFSRRPAVRRAAGLLIVVMGTLSLLHAIRMSGGVHGL